MRLKAAHGWQTTYGLRTHLNAVGSEFLGRGDHRLVGSVLHGPQYPSRPFTVDHPVDDDETFRVAGVSMTARFLPGHTPDSTLYTFELDDTLVGVCGAIRSPRMHQQGVLGGGESAVATDAARVVSIMSLPVPGVSFATDAIAVGVEAVIADDRHRALDVLRPVTVPARTVIVRCAGVEASTL